MKSVESMLWLLLFNVAIALVGGLEIFNVPSGPFISYEAMTSPGENSLYVFVSYSIIWAPLLAGAVGGAIAGVLGVRLKLSSASAYSAFGLFLTFIFVNTVGIFTTIIFAIENETARAGVSALVFIFLAITGVLFALGLIQLIRGGMESAI